MINYLLAGLLGLLFVTLAKMNGVKKDFDAAGHPFKASKFFRDEAIGICMSVVVILIMAITLREWGSSSEKIQKYIMCIFVLGGAIGSWAFSYFLGKSKKYIRTVIDLKTNIVDNEIGKSTTITDLKEKAADAGKDITPPTT